MSDSPEIFVFPNGFTLVHQRFSAAPVVALDLWVKAGGADEEPHQAGLAHVVEHMMFKGTARRAPGEAAREVENLGGEMNAFTSFDHTVYTITLSSRFAAQGVDILHDALTSSNFDQGELDREKLVILEEIKRTRDMPNQFLSRLLFSTAYRVHPYKNAVIGDERSVSGFSGDSCREFVGRWYVPENMTLVAVGDVDFEELKKLVAGTFGKLSGGRWKGRQPRPVEPGRAEFVFASRGRSVTEVYFDLAFAAPEAAHPDSPVLDLISTVLGDGESSRLNSRVKLDANLVRSVSAGVYIPADPGLFYLGGVVDEAKASEALKLIGEVTFELTTAILAPSELDRARERVEADFLFQLETAQSRAMKLGHACVVLGDINHERHYLERLNAVTPEIFRDTAAKYLKPDGATLCLIHPQGVRSPLTAHGSRKILVDALSPRKFKARAANAPRETRYTLPNGARLLIDRNHAAPLAALRVAFDGGTLNEPKGGAGLSHLTAECLPRGTLSRSVFDMAGEIDRLGGTLEGFSGKNSFGLHSEFLAKNLDAALELVCDVLNSPAFDPEEVEKALEDTLAAIRRREDNPAGRAFRAFETLLYGSHPYGRDVLGTLKSVERFKSADLKRFYAARTDPARMVFSVAGDVDPEEVRAQLAARLRLGAPTNGRAAAPAEPVRHTRPKIKRLDSPFEQTHIVLGYLGATVRDKDRLALKVANAMLSGQGGRLFAHLRDERALAYAVTSTSTDGVAPGYLAGYIATSPANAKEALEGLRREIAGLAVGRLDEEEVRKAERKLAGSHEISLQENSVRAAQMCLDELYGLDWLEFKSLAGKILKVSRADVEAVARKYLSTDGWVAALVGPG